MCDIGWTIPHCTCQRTPRPTCADVQHRDLALYRRNSAHTMSHEQSWNQTWLTVCRAVTSVVDSHQTTPHWSWRVPYQSQIDVKTLVVEVSGTGHSGWVSTSNNVIWSIIEKFRKQLFVALHLPNWYQLKGDKRQHGDVIQVEKFYLYAYFLRQTLVCIMVWGIWSSYSSAWLSMIDVRCWYNFVIIGKLKDISIGCGPFP